MSYKPGPACLQELDKKQKLECVTDEQKRSPSPVANGDLCGGIDMKQLTSCITPVEGMFDASEPISAAKDDGKPFCSSETGDSHLRNLFTSIFNEVRGKRFYGEVPLKGDEGHWQVSRYSFGAQKDLLSITMYGKNGSELDALPQSNSLVGAPSVDLLNFWAGGFTDSPDLLAGHGEQLSLDHVVTAVSGWERHVAMTPEYMEAWEAFFERRGESLKTYIFLFWPYGVHVGKEREAKWKEWISSKPRSFAYYFINMQHLHVHLKSKQLDFTWHDLCKIEDLNLLILAWEVCSGFISRSFAELVFTLAGPGRADRLLNQDKEAQWVEVAEMLMQAVCGDVVDDVSVQECVQMW
eukprot:gene13864-16386_t